MQHAVCLLSVIPMRKEPSHRSEMVSQILFGEFVSTGEEKDDFVFAKCLYDDYEGWVQAKQLTPVAEEEVRTTADYVGLYIDEVLVDGQCRMMPFGVPLYYAATPGDAVSFGKRKVLYQVCEGDEWNVSNEPFNQTNLNKVLLRFLGTPYLWGGKSIFGIDCSGFVQQVFKLFGAKLLRDAYLQAEQGQPVASVEEARLGDLAFFANEKGHITHVGFVLNDRKIVHASGAVRIDKLDEEGIVHAITGERTHRLHSIRRFPLSSAT